MSREAELKVAFDTCDADKSGKIPCVEIVKVLKAIGYEGNAGQVAAVSTLLCSNLVSASGRSRP